MTVEERRRMAVCCVVWMHVNGEDVLGEGLFFSLLGDKSERASSRFLLKSISLS